MPAPNAARPVDAVAEAWTPTEAETVALAYLQMARGDRWDALVCLAADALADLDAREAVIRARGRQISHGFVRGGLDA